MLKEHLQQRVYDFIDAHHLHDPRTYKANLEQLKKVFTFRRLPATSPTYAFSFRPEPFPNGPVPPVSIYVRDGLTYEERRMAIAHEVGHAILDHLGSHALYKIAPYFHTKDEREAWQAAAILLIPEHAIDDSPHVRWLERVTLTPAWLINEYPYVQRAFSLPMQTRPAMFR